MGAAEMPSMQLSRDMLGLAPRAGRPTRRQGGRAVQRPYRAVIDDRPRRTEVNTRQRSRHDFRRNTVRASGVEVYRGHKPHILVCRLGS
jgi:hypothetical protein